MQRNPKGAFSGKALQKENLVDNIKLRLNLMQG